MPNWKYIWYDIEERWDRLGLRDWINKNPKAVIGISIASVLIFLLIVITQLMPYRSPAIPQTSKAWFYDLNTGKLFVEDGDKIPPVKAPSGKLADGQPGGVRAHVFSYSSNPSESERFIGYLEKFTPEGKEIVSSFRKSEDKVTRELIKQLNRNRFVRRVDDDEWFSADSKEGRIILEQALLTNESGETAQYCLPR